MTNRCKNITLATTSLRSVNITLPQTSFASGDKKVSLHVEKVNAKASSLPNENVLFVYTGEKVTSLPDGFMGNPIECSR